jgi:hypothetical protein
VSPLIHLIYASVATELFEKASLIEILNKARQNNEFLGLTGMLLYSAGSFFQVLEGEPAVVDSLYRKLMLDKRHTQLTSIIRERIAKRDFESWTMGFSDISQEEVAKITGLNDFFSHGSCFSGLNNNRARKLLTAFSEGRWREKLVGPAKSPA